MRHSDYAELGKVDLSVAAVACPDKARRNLNGVLIEPGKTAATDGHCLAEIKDKRPMNPEGVAFWGVIAATDIPKLDKDDWVEIEKGKNGKVNLRISGNTVKSIEPVDADFPDYERTIIQSTLAKPVKHTVALDAKLLMKLLRIHSEAKRDIKHGPHIVEFAFYEGTSEFDNPPIFMRSSTQDKEVTTILMPIRG